MQPCMETRAPLAANLAPAWALRVARPVTDTLPLAEELQGVPKPALQIIFGKSLGQRIWQQARTKCPSAGTPPLGPVADREISAGLVAYVSRQAARALHGSGRQANGLSMTITYADGEERLARTPLARPTNAGDEIAEVAMDLLRKMPVRGVALVSIRLTMTAIKSSRIEPPAVRAPARDFGRQMRPAPTQT
jgi:hypothetical protein